ncbi:MAG: type IX secretion system protein PorQ [Cyclobacteriaceae bacterium]
MKYLIFIAILVSIEAKAQFGQYQVLDLPSGARSAALGGTMVSLADGEIQQFMNNPAVLDSVSLTDVSFSYNPYFADINVFSGAFYGNVGKAGPIAFGITYASYGEFDETDDAGNKVGSFTARDYVIAVGKSHSVGLFTLGVNAKLAQSAIESYSSTALTFDLGGVFRMPNKDISFGMAFKNFGFILSDYAVHQSDLPFDVQLGLTVKPEHMPFKFTLTTYNLVEENLIFRRENEDATSRTSATFDKALRRINIGAELILNKAIQFQIGYNHLRRQELKLDEKAGGAGFSYGISIGVKKIKFRYARAKYHIAGGANFISLETNLNKYKKIL